ncbi:10461_t:CDS:2, partial [Scutellospora calospora]
KITEFENEITKLTNNVKQMELDNEDLNNQVNRMKIEVESKNIKIEKLEQLYYTENCRYDELENKLFEEEKSKRLNQKCEKVCFERNDEHQSIANLRTKIIDLETENRKLRSKLLLRGSTAEQLSSLQVKYQKSVGNNWILSNNLEIEYTELETLRKENKSQKEYLKTKEDDIMKLKRQWW